MTIAAPPGEAAPAAAATTATMTIAASADVNPDADARPSPVVVRIYQLRGEARFRSADFLPLFDEEKMVLGDELITRDEFVLAPSETRTLAVTLAPATRFVGALAAFRDFRSADWRAIVPAARGGLVVSVERTRVVLKPAN